jgi:hypothetical protein
MTLSSIAHGVHIQRLDCKYFDQQWNRLAAIGGGRMQAFQMVSASIQHIQQPLARRQALATPSHFYIEQFKSPPINLRSRTIVFFSLSGLMRSSRKSPTKRNSLDIGNSRHNTHNYTQFCLQ